MTRIISGFAGSLALTVPGSGTRPTSDRVREAIFSALESRDAIRGSRVLDLYAGSGALGLEAASRGASAVVLVERAPSAARACRENVARVLRNAPADARPTITVAAHAVSAFLGMGTTGAAADIGTGTGTAAWDLVFIDPPYDLDNQELTDNLKALGPLLAPGAIVVVERAVASGEPVWPHGVNGERERRYGDTKLWWASAG